MRHSLKAEKWGLRIRPVELSDAKYIFDLRWRPGVGDHIGDTAATVADQKAWIERYFERQDDLYFLVELTSGRPVGTVGIYEIKSSTAEWGRWIIEPGIPAAVGCAWLVYYMAFSVLNLPEVYGRTVTDNKKVISFHDRCGLTRRGLDVGGATIRGKTKDLIYHVAAISDWPRINAVLSPLALFAEKKLAKL